MALPTSPYLTAADPLTLYPPPLAVAVAYPPPTQIVPSLLA
jgi:hypothetical protein